MRHYRAVATSYESRFVADRLSGKQGVVVVPRGLGHRLWNAVHELFDLKVHFKLQRHLRAQQISNYS